jgi:hypothetical protein
VASEDRPIERADYEWVQALIFALEARIKEPETPLWEHLAFFHRKYLGDDSRVGTLDLAGDGGYALEREHVLRVVQALSIGQSTVTDYDEPIERACGTPGCPNTATAIYLPN